MLNINYSGYGNNIIDVKYDTIYEDENGLEDDDPNYDEYNRVLF